MDRMLLDVQEFKLANLAVEARLRTLETRVAVMGVGYGAVGGGIAALVLSLINKALGL
jgi:hypothetical protein